jgi:hypothetical protein
VDRCPGKKKRILDNGSDAFFLCTEVIECKYISTSKDYQVQRSLDSYHLGAFPADFYNTGI